MDEEELTLPVHPEAVLLAALVASFHLDRSVSPNANVKERTQAHRAMTLDWLDWAVCESDLGRELMKAKAEAAHNRKGNGNITVRKPE